MSSLFVNQIQSTLGKYLSGTSSLREFDEAFLSIAWDAPEALDSEASKLRGEIFLLLAEYASGHWSESELKQQFREIATLSTARSGGS
jgi:hypothetical protein